MDTQTLTIIALFVNIGALVFVGVQTILTRRALKFSEMSFHESQRVRELSDLPKANLVLAVKAEIESWKGQLQKIIDDEEAIKTRIRAGDKTFGSEYGREKSAGIISKWLHDNSPNWMQVLYVSAAQYYYECKGLVWIVPQEPKIALNLFVEAVKLAKTGVLRISEILAYIDKITPDWYLECPARLDDSDLM